MSPGRERKMEDVRCRTEDDGQDQVQQALHHHPPEEQRADS